jgi:hypothetical protein
MRISLKLAIFVTASFLFASCGEKQMSNNVISQNEFYTVTGDSVIQGKFVATAVSPTEIKSNYVSPADAAFSPVIEFRLSFNSRDNELLVGQSHFAVVGTDSIIKVGVPQKRPSTNAKPLAHNTPWTLRVDLSPVLKSFADKGYYVTATGDSIFKEEFKGVWIAGSAAPMTWDFDNLYHTDPMKLHPTAKAGIYEITMLLNPPAEKADGNLSWKINAPSKDYPQYSSDQTLIDALYNMSIDNIIKDYRPDGTFRAGSSWDGVWTRDVSYSEYLSLAFLNPTRSMNSLKAKVKNGRIIQDTGTGGSWPISSDREVWATAAWEIYKVTGDKNWLHYAFNVIKASIDDDRNVVWDRYLGLMHGEQSFLDWREQSYAKWMQPKDIFESMCLGTNVVFANAYYILGEMGDELGIKNNYSELGDHIKDALNQNLWREDKGYYSEFLYGGAYPVQSPGIDNLGQALSVIWNIADDDRAEKLIENTPFTPYGIPAIFPRQQNIKPYHNDAVWPFVQAFWNLAAAKAGNENAVRRGLGAMYRAAAFFGTNKELLVASTGDYRGSAVNNNRQLWSAAGNVAMIFRLYAGMDFKTNGIEFNPFVPTCLAGKKTITGFKYRNSVLNITIQGSGNDIDVMTIDGKECEDNFFPANNSGNHNIVIKLKNGKSMSQAMNLMPVSDMPLTPSIAWNGKNGNIANYVDGAKYSMFINGEMKQDIDSPHFVLDDFSNYTRIFLVPQNKQWSGFMARPHEIIPADAMKIYQCEKVAVAGTNFIKGPKSKNFVEISTSKNTDINIPVIVDQPGSYFVDVRYANGCGPINTDNCCAIRSLFANGHLQGAIVMPQRGSGEWLNTGFSNMLIVELVRGKNNLEIKYVTPQNINMNGTTNTALIDYVRLIKKK